MEHNNNNSRPTRQDRDSVVLCTAEAYGFGPAAALWTVYKHLRPRVSTSVKWHYVGCRHSLSLHVGRNTDPQHGWDVVHDVDVSGPDGADRLKALFERLRPVLFVDVLDPAAAAVAVEADVPLVVIDPIFWWFPELPEAWHEARLVLAPNFFGVEERVARERLRNVEVVPPLAPALDEAEGQSREGVVINLGGLRNPLAAKSVHVDYARLIYQCARRVIDERSERLGISVPLRVWASPEIVQSLPDGVAVTVTPEQAHAGMRECALLCITPGLGNLFDAAACASNVLLLPPTNDSQGQQAEALQRELGIDACIHWNSLTGQAPLDYHQPMTLLTKDVTAALDHVQADDWARARLCDRIRYAIEDALNPNTMQRTLRPLVSRFGADDGSAMAVAIAREIQRLEPELVIKQV